jgi:hypothetical protein
MPTDFGLILPPWNFATTAGNLLDRVVGEVGIDFLTVPVVTGESQQFRLASGFATPYFFTEGGWHFQPELSLYKACGLRPPVACWCGKRDTLGPIQEYAERHGLKLLFTVHLAGLEGIASQQPGLCPCNAWGDELTWQGASAFHPAWRELVGATLADLTRYAPAGFVLGGLWHEVWVGDPVDSWDDLEEWFDASFSSAALQAARRAGVDVDAARQAVQRLYAERQRAGMGGETAEAVPELPPVLLEYERALRGDLAAWLTRLRQEYASLRMLRGPVHDLVTPGWETLRRPLCDWLDSAALADWFAEDVSEPSETALVLSAEEAEGGDAGAFVRAVTATVRAGVRSVSFEDVELVPDEFVTWLKQAVRYSRREGRS